MQEMQENYKITPCFVNLHRIDDNLINLHLKKYGLKVESVFGDSKREETPKESLPSWPGTISKEKSSLKRKKENEDDSSSKILQNYSTNENLEDSSPLYKYFSKTNGTNKIKFSKIKKNYLEYETSCPCKLDQKKKNYLKASPPIAKTLDEKSERMKMGEKNKCSRQTSQSKIESMMKRLKKLPGNQEETVSRDAFAHFPKQSFKNVSKTFPAIHMCKKKSNENINNAILMSEVKLLKGVDKECSQFREMLKREQKIETNVSQTEKNVQSYTVGRGYGSRICDVRLNTNVKNEHLDEDEYDSRGEDSEDDKQTVIFDEKFDALGKLKESSEKVSECKQENAKTNKKGRNSKSPRTLKQRKPSLVRIIKKEKMVARKKLGKPTRKIGRKATERSQIEKTEETIRRSNKFVQKFEDVLAEISSLVKHLHDTHKIISHLKKDMEENKKLSEHFKTVIEAQQENYRKEIWKSQETIMKGYDKMMSFCKKSSTVSLEISKRTFLSIEDVENVLSRCILVENALEMLKPTQKLSAGEKDVLKEREGQGISACFEKKWSIGRSYAAPLLKSSEIIGKEPHCQVISLDECQDQFAPEKGLRISNNLYPNNSVKPSGKHLAFSNSASSVPCSFSTCILKERQVMPPRQSARDRSEDLVLHKSQSHELNHFQVPYQSSQKSRVNFINRAQDHHENYIPTMGSFLGGQRFDFVQHGKSREKHIQPENNIQNQLLISQKRHCLKQQQITKSLSQFLTSGSVQQILTIKRPPRPQNPIPCVFQPEVEMYSKRGRQQCHQQQGLIHGPSVQRRINVESNFAVPFNPVTSGPFNQGRYSYLPHLMSSNLSMFVSDTPIRESSKPLSSRNNMTSTSHSTPSQEQIPSQLLQPNTTIANVTNTSAMPASTPVRSHNSSIPVLPRQLKSPPTFSKDINSCRMTEKAQSKPSLRISNPIEHIPLSTKSLHPIAQYSTSKTNGRALQGLRESKNSVSRGSCIGVTCSTPKKSKSETQLFDPTIPQKLTMRNLRLQAGTILISSEEVTKSKSQPNENQMNRMIKTESINLQELEKEPGTQKIARRNSSRKYECAQNGCKNSGIRICKGCKSVIYCSGTCHMNHWKQKHKEECAKLRELRG